jgi:hypothetical protein
VDAIAHQLMRVHSGECRRLLINQPPRSLKSICVESGHKPPIPASSSRQTGNENFEDSTMSGAAYSIT